MRNKLFRSTIILFMLPLFSHRLYAGHHDPLIKNSFSHLGFTLESFTAIPENGHTILQWRIQKKIVASHFVVEHSVDGTSFDSVAVVTNNNSNQSYTYSYTHTSAVTDHVNYYRLKQVDKNGKTSYSYIRVVRFTEERMQAVRLEHSSITDKLEINTLANNLRIVITDMNDKTVLKMKLGDHNRVINTCKWKAGLYQLSVYKRGKLLETKSIVKF